MSKSKPSRRCPYQAISFACFGTLVDRDRGLSTALARATGILDPSPLRDFVQSFDDAEARRIDELEEFAGYEPVMTAALADAAEACGIPLDAPAITSIVESMPLWPLYDDALRALSRLAGSVDLAVATQLDSRVAARVLVPAGVSFRHIVGSEHVGCFKPEPDHLMALVHELELDEEELLHVAAEPLVDLEPAIGLGAPVTYVDRFGYPVPEELEPVPRVANLDELADRLLGRAADSEKG